MFVLMGKRFDFNVFREPKLGDSYTRAQVLAVLGMFTTSF